MRRELAIILTLALALALSACAKQGETRTEQTPAAPAPDGAAVEAMSEAVPPEWRYEVTTQSEADRYVNADGVELASVSYELPRLVLAAEGDTDGWEPPEDMQAVCDAFNDGVARYRETLTGAQALGEDAQSWYKEMDPEYRPGFPTYAEECEVASVRQRGDLLDVLLMEYGYWGGAHGGETYRDLHFDLRDGAFFTLGDLSDRPEELIREIGYNILGKIWENDQEAWYFNGYVDTIQNKEDFTFSLGEEGMSVYFEEYEIAPYAAGMPEFLIPYAEFSRYLNERGERLLALPAEDRALGDYYEAEEMWYWFEGAMPLDEADAYTVRWEDSDYDEYYYRVDIPGVSSVADLKDLLRGRFADEVVDKRFDWNGVRFFAENDGKLYAIPAGRGTDVTIKSVDYAAELNSDGKGGKIVATIHWQDYDEEKEDWYLTGETGTAEFPFELTENGARFTDFQAIW